MSICSFSVSFFQMPKICTAPINWASNPRPARLLQQRVTRRRVGVEGTFFGTYGEKIRYAALSLDGTGLKSYGEYSIRLWEIAIKDRTSLLEENTYDFVEHHGIIAGHSGPP